MLLLHLYVGRLVDNSALTGTVHEIPSGSNRTFTINAYDDVGALRYTGSAIANVSTGETVVVSISVVSTGQGNTAGAELSILPPVDVTRFPGGTTAITGTVLNSGTTTATGIVVNFRAKNRNGTFVSEANVEIAEIRANESVLFTLRYFEDTSLDSSSLRYVTSVDYNISYVGGGPDMGSVAIGDVSSGGVGTVVLNIVSPIVVNYLYIQIKSSVTFTGEIDNPTSETISDIQITFVARNSSGGAMGQTTVSLGSVGAGKTFFTGEFPQEAFSSNGAPISTIDYSIEHSAGGPDTGSVSTSN